MLQLKCLFLRIVNNEWPSNNEVGRGCERLRDATMARDLRSVARDEVDFSVALRSARVAAKSCEVELDAAADCKGKAVALYDMMHSHGTETFASVFS